MIDPAGKHALVTGGSRRVGAAMVSALAASGVDVAIHHRSSADDAEALRPDAPADAWVMADDSGLFVHALDGRPGVYSSRYAGPDATYADNCNLLIKELGDSHQRGAAFGCVLYCIAPDGAVLISAGVLPGEITREASGSDGFGYDPVFRPLSDDRTLAEMTRDEKAAISHRGRAARGMARLMGIGDGGAGDSHPGVAA